MDNAVRNLLFDLSFGREIFDEESGRVINSANANETLRTFVKEELGLSDRSTHRDIKRALDSEKGKQLFRVIEEIVDQRVSTGWTENEFFNQFVDTRNVADGDSVDFWAERDIILTVGKVSGDHHDLIVQKLGEGSPIQVPTSVYAIKVGAFIREFILGRKNWNEFVDAVAKAFIKKIQDEVYTQFMAASNQLVPSAQFNKTGTLVKATLDTLIEDVSTANDGAPVMIMGTKTALRSLTAIADVNWIAASSKESVANTGLISNYEGSVLFEIPQRFANNDVTHKLIDDTHPKLLIMPQVDIKPVKFVDYGETEITVDQIAEKMDDRQTYEVQRRMGVGTIFTRYFGTWTM